MEAKFEEVRGPGVGDLGDEEEVDGEAHGEEGEEEEEDAHGEVAEEEEAADSSGGHRRLSAAAAPAADDAAIIVRPTKPDTILGSHFEVIDYELEKNDFDYFELLMDTSYIHLKGSSDYIKAMNETISTIRISLNTTKAMYECW